MNQETEQNKTTGPRWRVGNRFKAPPGAGNYKFTVSVVEFSRWGEWVYTCRFDHGLVDVMGEEGLEWNVQIG